MSGCKHFLFALSLLSYAWGIQLQSYLHKAWRAKHAICALMYISILFEWPENMIFRLVDFVAECMKGCVECVLACSQILNYWCTSRGQHFLLFLLDYFFICSQEKKKRIGFCSHEVAALGQLPVTSAVWFSRTTDRTAAQQPPRYLEEERYSLSR